MKQTAVDFLYEFVQLKLTNVQQSQFEGLFHQAKAMEEIEKHKRQLFIGKVSEIIGMDKTIKLWKECIETFKSE